MQPSHWFGEVGDPVLLVSSYRFLQVKETRGAAEYMSALGKTVIFSEPLHLAQPEVPRRRTYKDSRHLLIWKTQACGARG